MNIFYANNISGNNYTLPEEESKHCIKVLRMKVGDELTLVDGKGVWYHTKIAIDNPKKCEVEIIRKEQDKNNRPYKLHIAIAPTKNIDRMEWFIEKATEIGIDEITPIICEHSERSIVKIDRLEKVAIAAMKQSLKAWLPQINDPIKFNDFIQNNNADQKFIAHCHSSELPLLSTCLINKISILVLIGPEGDFSKTEVTLSLQHGFKEISLGASRLRTETAGIMAVSIASL